VPNWAKAKLQMEDIINKNGVTVQWLSRVTSGSDAYNTGSSITFGYGDETRYWVTGSVKALIECVRVEDVVLEAGFFLEDYKRIYVDPDETIEYWDEIIFPSGSGERFLIQPIHYWIVGDVTVSKYAIIRKLLPRSGSQY